MLRLAQAPNRLRERTLYGAVAYWGLNVVLLLVEARWHVLYHLTLWDISMIRTILVSNAQHVH
jgi:hypothetical protein